MEFVTKLARTAKLWVDSDSYQLSESNKGGLYLWVRIAPFIVIHVVCFYGLLRPFSVFDVGLCVISYAIRMFAVTGIYHRYFSHRTYKINRVWQFIFALVGCSAVQRGPLWWAAHHREHHKNSDTDLDIHSPVAHSFWQSHVGWFVSRKSFNTNYDRVKDWSRYPELIYVNRFSMLVPIILSLVMFVIGETVARVYEYPGIDGLQVLLWAMVIPTVLVWHATYTINSICHKLGSQRYKTNDNSRNNWFLALITFGEGWHNNHHYYPSSARQGFYWWELDITFYILKILSYMGIVRELRGIPERVFLERAA